MQLGWMKQNLVAKKKMDFSLQNVEKNIYEDFTELHGLTHSPSELINVTTIWGFFGYHSTGQQTLYVF